MIAVCPRIWGNSCRGAVPDPSVSHPGFLDSGDSGSLLFGGEGDAVAMLWSDREDFRARKDSVHFVTPLQDILSDVKETGKGSLDHEDWELLFL